ncbi:MAG TPA: ABC transporter substrate-binding protein [Stellaceae bacterium]|nr:ABC transporter substrate-binding protein [Stellaceae bacterium]
MQILRLLAALAAVAWLSAPAEAAQGDATQVIAGFQDTLVDVMKAAKKLGFDGRYKLLEPAVDSAFDIPFMTRVVTGSRWNNWSSTQQTEVTAAFRRFVIATYARRFDDYDGEQFRIEETKPVSDGTLVRTEVVHAPDPPITLTYLMKDADDHPKVVDVFMTGTISELATRRSEFAAILDHDGYQGLLTALDQKSKEK